MTDAALVTLREHLLNALEQAFASTLHSLRRELSGGEAEPGDIEYASWLQALRN